MDPVREQLAAQRLEEPAHRELRRRVRGVAEHADEPGRRRHAHDAPAAALDHRGHDRPHDVDRAEVVDVHHLAEQVGIELLEVPGPGLARRAHDHVDRPERRGEGRQRRRDLRRVGHVGGGDRHLPAGRADRARGARRARRAAGRSARPAPRGSTAIRAVARPIPLDPPVTSTWAPAKDGTAGG